MGKKKRAWNSSNPLYRYLHGGKKAKASRSRRSGTMARRRSGRRSRGGGGGMFGGDMVSSGLKGMGAAALTKRFVGAPLGGFTGAAVGYLLTKSLYGAVGGYVHDNIGNVGGASGTSGNYLN